MTRRVSTRTLRAIRRRTRAGTGTFYDNYDTGLAVDTSYSYRGFASNIKGDSPYSNIVTVATVPVSATLNTVTSVAGSDSKLTLTWTDNAHHTLYFQLWRKGPGQTTFTNFANWGNDNYYGGGNPGFGAYVQLHRHWPDCQQHLFLLCRCLQQCRRQ